MTLPLQDPLLSAEGQGQPSHRTGFFRTVLRERKSAVVGLSIIVFFVVLSIIAPYISPHSVTQPSCAVYAPPSSEQRKLALDSRSEKAKVAEVEPLNASGWSAIVGAGGGVWSTVHA